MKTDIEMLEAAAKAAGVRHVKPTEGYSGALGLEMCDEYGRPMGPWSPLTDDGDALRLAVAMALEIRPGVGMVTAAGDGVWEEVPTADYTREQATRRAIVEAAAIIGAG